MKEIILFSSVVLIICSSICSGQRQELKYYDYTQGIPQNESSLNFTTTRYLQDLDPKNFFGIDTSAMLGEGFWICYDGPDYARNGIFFVDIAIFGGRYSFRFAGSPQNYTIPSITLYSGFNFANQELKIYDDTANLSFNFSSAVIVAKSFTLYTKSNFEGESYCLEPTRTNRPVLYNIYEDVNKLGIVPGNIKAIKFGCDCEPYRLEDVTGNTNQKTLN